MERIERTLLNVIQILELVEEEDWSEEDLVKTVKLLHSETEHHSLSALSLLTGETIL